VLSAVSPLLKYRRKRGKASFYYSIAHFFK